MSWFTTGVMCVSNLRTFCLTWGKSPATTRWKLCKTLTLQLIAPSFLWSSARVGTRWRWCVDIRIPSRSSLILATKLSPVSLRETVWLDHRVLLFAYLQWRDIVLFDLNVWTFWVTFSVIFCCCLSVPSKNTLGQLWRPMTMLAMKTLKRWRLWQRWRTGWWMCFPPSGRRNWGRPVSGSVCWRQSQSHRHRSTRPTRLGPREKHYFFERFNLDPVCQAILFVLGGVRFKVHQNRHPFDLTLTTISQYLIHHSYFTPISRPDFNLFECLRI